MPMKLDNKLILNVYHETSTSRRNAIEGTEWPEKIRKAFVCRLYRYNKYVPCFSPLTSTSYSLPSTTSVLFSVENQDLLLLISWRSWTMFCGLWFWYLLFIHLFLDFYNYCYLIAVHPSSHSSYARCLCMTPTLGPLHPKPVCKALEA